MDTFLVEDLVPYLREAGYDSWRQLLQLERLRLLDRAVGDGRAVVEMYCTTVNKLVQYAQLPLEDARRESGACSAFMEQLSLITRLIQVHVDVSDTWAGVIAHKYPLNAWATSISGTSTESGTAATWQLVCDPTPFPAELRVLVTLRRFSSDAAKALHVEESITLPVPSVAMPTLASRWEYIREVFPNFDRKQALAYLRKHPLTQQIMLSYDRQLHTVS